MATYNKRGYKAPKEKEVKEVTEETQVIVDEKDSTTAGVFSKLDETASRTEDWVAKNQKIIIGLVAGIAVLTIGYLAYQKFIEAPKQDEAANEMFVAQQNFQKATDGVASDSLYKLALNGSEGKFGFVKIGTFASQISFEYVLDTLFSIVYANSYTTHLVALKNKERILAEDFFNTYDIEE